MERQFNLSINTPCSEKFENFQSTATGGFCSACSKNVIDFTEMSDAEILKHFKNVTHKTCGKFSKSQLKTYSEVIASTPRTNFKWLGVGVMGFSLLLPIKNSLAQRSERSTPMVVAEEDSLKKKNTDDKADKGEHIVKGTVVYEGDNEPLPGVNVVLKGSEIGTVTDVDGMFIFPKPLQTGDVLIFSFIGLQTEEFKVGSNAPDVIDMKMLVMEFDLMGEVAVNEVYSSKQSWWQQVKTLFK
jgi:hypothetical protein